MTTLKDNDGMQPGPSFKEILDFLDSSAGCVPEHDDDSFMFGAEGPEGGIIVTGQRVELDTDVVLVCECRHVARVEHGRKAVRHLIWNLNWRTFVGQWHVDPDGEIRLQASVLLSPNDWQDQLNFILATPLHYARAMQSMLVAPDGPKRKVAFINPREVA